MMQPKSDELKTRRLSPRNLCIVFYGGRELGTRPDSYKLNFYIVADARERDIGDGVEFPHLKPTIQFQGFKKDSPRVAFCAVNSTLYMFEGDNLSEPRDIGVKAFHGKYAGKFEMNPQILAAGSNTTTKQLVKKDLFALKPMHRRKNYPIAVPTPDGKGILVFSSSFYWVYPGPGRYDSSFELYNIAEDTWTRIEELPKEPHWACRKGRNTVVAYGFASPSRFLVQLHEDLMFALNLHTLKWEAEADFAEAPLPWPKGSFFGFDGLQFTAGGAYWLQEYGSALFRFHPGPPEFPDDHDVDDDDPWGDDRRFYATLDPCIALLRNDEYGYDANDGGAFDIGVVRARKPLKEAFVGTCFYVMLDTCRIDKGIREQLKGYMLACEGQEQVIPDDDGPSLQITESKTLKFMVDFDCTSFVHGVMNVFSI